MEMRNIQLQFITHATDSYDHLEGARMALEGGCRWIQLRMKGAVDSEVVAVGQSLRRMCDHYGATMILDDRVLLVDEIGADGVHLGQRDMPIDEARHILGPDKIIGGTANTIEEIVIHAKRGADYLGCGPFRFTSTKVGLAPLLGLEGYEALLREMHSRSISIPLVAIGGIRLEDIQALTNLGISGVAISSAILQSEDPTDMTQAFIHQLNS